MSLRDISHQAAIELDELDTEYVASLKQERVKLWAELKSIPTWKYFTKGARQRRRMIHARLARIKELLAK